MCVPRGRRSLGTRRLSDCRLGKGIQKVEFFWPVYRLTVLRGGKCLPWETACERVKALPLD